MLQHLRPLCKTALIMFLKTEVVVNRQKSQLLMAQCYVLWDAPKGFWSL